MEDEEREGSISTTDLFAEIDDFNVTDIYFKYPIIE